MRRHAHRLTIHIVLHLRSATVEGGPYIIDCGRGRHPSYPSVRQILIDASSDVDVLVPLRLSLLGDSAAMRIAVAFLTSPLVFVDIDDSAAVAAAVGTNNTCGHADSDSLTVVVYESVVVRVRISSLLIPLDNGAHHFVDAIVPPNQSYSTLASEVMRLLSHMPAASPVAPCRLSHDGLVPVIDDSLPFILSGTETVSMWLLPSAASLSALRGEQHAQGGRDPLAVAQLLVVRALTLHRSIGGSGHALLLLRTFSSEMDVLSSSSSDLRALHIKCLVLRAMAGICFDIGSFIEGLQHARGAYQIFTVLRSSPVSAQLRDILLLLARLALASGDAHAAISAADEWLLDVATDSRESVSEGMALLAEALLEENNNISNKATLIRATSLSRLALQSDSNNVSALLGGNRAALLSLLASSEGFARLTSPNFVPSAPLHPHFKGLLAVTEGAIEVAMAAVSSPSALRHTSYVLSALSRRFGVGPALWATRMSVFGGPTLATDDSQNRSVYASVLRILAEAMGSLGGAQDNLFIASALFYEAQSLDSSDPCLLLALLRHRSSVPEYSPLQLYRMMAAFFSTPPENNNSITNAVSAAAIHADECVHEGWAGGCISRGRILCDIGGAVRSSLAASTSFDGAVEAAGVPSIDYARNNIHHQRPAIRLTARSSPPATDGPAFGSTFVSFGATNDPPHPLGPMQTRSCLPTATPVEEGLVGLFCVLCRQLFIDGRLDVLSLALSHPTPSSDSPMSVINALKELAEEGLFSQSSVRNELAYLWLIVAAMQYVPLYDTIGRPDRISGPLYCLGDSHIVPLAWQPFPRPPSTADASSLNKPTEGALLAVPLLVPGVKLWHLGGGRDSAGAVPVRRVFEAFLSAIPDDSIVLLSLGEIDTREGVLQNVERGRYADAATCVRSLVGAYRRLLLSAAARFRRVYVLYPPSVLPETRIICRLFWDALDEGLFLSVADAEPLLPPNVWPLRLAYTLSPDGYRLDSRFTLDGTHLSPLHIRAGLYQQMLLRET